MKAKKAVKKLEKVESILQRVMKDYSAIEPGPRRLLDNAKELATRARTDMTTSRKGPGRASTKTSAPASLADAG